MSAESDKRRNAAKLRELAAGYWLSQCVAVVAELGVADLLNSGPKPVDELARATATKSGPLYRVLRALASYGIFTESADHWFALTPMAEMLQSSRDSLRGWAVLVGSEEFHRAWDDLRYSLKTGEPAFNHLYGASYWEHVSRNPKIAAIFNEGLTAYTSQVASAVVAGYDFSQLRKLVDVGGGHGVLISAVLVANPKLRGLLFDLPHAREGATRTLAEAAVRERCDIISGDFFQEIPKGADAYLLSAVIHDWDDERALNILGNCRRAMDANARLLLVEAVIPPGNEPFFGKLLDVHMLVITDQGTDRTVAEYRTLLEKAGFKVSRIVPTASDVSVIEALLA